MATAAAAAHRWLLPPPMAFEIVARVEVAIEAAVGHQLLLLGVLLRVKVGACPAVGLAAVVAGTLPSTLSRLSQESDE